jgi:hypothetical protein
MNSVHALISFKLAGFHINIIPYAYLLAGKPSVSHIKIQPYIHVLISKYSHTFRFSYQNTAIHSGSHIKIQPYVQVFISKYSHTFFIPPPVLYLFLADDCRNVVIS